MRYKRNTSAYMTLVESLLNIRHLDGKVVDCRPIHVSDLSLVDDDSRLVAV